LTDDAIRDLGLSGIAVGPNRMRALRPDVVKTLAESMKASGLLQPIVVRPRGAIGFLLVVGHHRYEAARLLKWPSIKATIKEGMDADRALLAEIDENLIRADLTPVENSAHYAKRAELYLSLYPETKHGGAPGAGRGKQPRSQSEHDVHFVKAFADATAEKTGQTRQNVQRAVKRGKAISDIVKLAGTSLDEVTELDALARMEEAHPEEAAELKRRAIDGEKVSAKTVEKQVRRAKLEEELAQATVHASENLGTKLYGVIYVDPPWRFQPWSRETGMDRAADNHYPTEQLSVLKSIQIPAADDAVMFMWATAPMLFQAGELMTAWGFTYRSHCVWVKPHAGTGYWFRNRHELLLVGTKGKIPAPAPGTQYDSVIEAPLGAHSKKPNAFAEMIEDMFPNMPALEMFARGPRLGWQVWGNEATEPVEAAE